MRMDIILYLVFFAALVWAKIQLDTKRRGDIMKNFSFKTRLIYFGGIALVSLAFFALQLYSVQTTEAGTGSMVLLILWGLLAAFGIGGLVYTVAKRDRHPK